MDKINFRPLFSLEKSVLTFTLPSVTGEKYSSEKARREPVNVLHKAHQANFSQAHNTL